MIDSWLELDDCDCEYCNPNYEQERLDEIERAQVFFGLDDEYAPYKELNYLM